MVKVQSTTLLEIGFGTGLNALLTLTEALKIQSRISYATLEAHPLPSEVWSKLNYADLVGYREFFEQLHQLPWNAQQEVSPTFLFTKYYQTLQDNTLKLPLYFPVSYHRSPQYF